MNERQTPAGIIPNQADTSILEDPHQKEVQEDIWQHEKKKTMYALFGIGAVLLIANIIAYSSANAFDSYYLLDITLFPTIFLGLALFARLQPMISAIGGIAVIVVITILGIMAHGAVYLIAGWLVKVIALYFIITSVRHAKDAEQAKKQLQLLG